jgi:eukaryotic-like serine/threonine-protein kinase
VGPYRVIRYLGGGGQARVYEAADPTLPRCVAVKVFEPGSYGHIESETGLPNEVQALSRLRHPAIATVLSAGKTAEGKPYVAMELVGGTPLNEFVEENDVDFDRRMRLFLRICEGVRYAHHREVIHCDLKPTNIMVSRDRQPKILDFGLARINPSSGAPAPPTTGDPIGTLGYMSPEQARGEPLDHRTDVYSLGVILYELVTGRLPSQIDGLPARAAVQIICNNRPIPFKPPAGHRQVPRGLELVIYKSLEKSPTRRYQTAGSLGRALRRALTDGDVRLDSGSVRGTGRLARLIPTFASMGSREVLPFAAAGLVGAVTGLGAFALAKFL